MAASPIATHITIGGQMLGSFGAMIRNSKLGLMSLQSTALKTNATITGIGKGLLGLGGSFLAFESIKGFLNESVKLSKEAGATTAALTAIITNQNKLRGIGAEQSKTHVEAIERQSKALQEQTGIYKEIFMHGAATLSQYKLSTEQIKMMQPAIADLMTYQRQMGIDSAGDFDAIGKALLGFPRGLKAIGIEWNQIQLKTFQHLSTANKLRAIYQEIEQQHGGAGAKFGDSLAGQAVKAKFHWMETMATIGDSWKPVFQKMQIFWGSMADIIGPPLIKLSKFVAENFDSWVKIMKDSVIPVIRQIVSQGWDFLSAGITFFKNNSSWLLPWIGEVIKFIGIWTFVIGPLINVIKDLRLVLIALQLSSPWGIIAVAAGIAAYEVITHWTEVKKFFAHFWESVVGTANFNSTEAKGVLKAFKKGEVPRAQPVELGWIGTLNKWGAMWDAWLPQQWGKFVKWLEQLGQSWDAAVFGWFKDAGNNLRSWLESTGQSWDAAVLGWVKGAGDGIRQWLVSTGQSWDATVLGWWNSMIAGIQSVGKSWYDAVLGWVNYGKNVFGSWMTNIHDGWTRTIDQIKAIFDSWMQYLQAGWNKITSWWNPIISGIKSVGDVIQVWLIDKIKAVNDQWQAFLNFITGTPQKTGDGDKGGTSGGSGATGSWNKNTAAAAQHYAQLPYSGTGVLHGGFVGHEADFIAAGKKYGIDPNLMAAISDVETAGGTSHVFRSRNNPGGLTGPGHNGVGGNYMPYGSVTDGIYAMAKFLVPYYRRGQRTPETIGPVWAPTGHVANDPNDSNAQWPGAVRARLRKFHLERDVKPTPTPPIHIENHVTYNIQGGDEHRIAALHQQHIERLKKDLEEAQYEHNRRRFVS